jgi:hypothetical protein
MSRQLLAVTVLHFLVELSNASRPNQICFAEPNKQTFPQWALTIGFATALPFLAAFPQSTSAEIVEWNLSNGSVRLENPLSIVLESTNAATSQRPLTLRNPQLIGSGGGGAVFAFDDSSTLIKVSWEASAKSVERECRTLQALEKKNVEGAERCLGRYTYPADAPATDSESYSSSVVAAPRRVMIAVDPYVPDAVASIAEVSKGKQPDAVAQIVRTMVQMLGANVVTIDVQPLISKETGSVLFIDMTEAQNLSPPYSFLDRTLMSSFTTEMWTLIPEKFYPLAYRTVGSKIDALRRQGIELSSEALEILEAQTDLQLTK